MSHEPSDMSLLELGEEDLKRSWVAVGYGAVDEADLAPADRNLGRTLVDQQLQAGVVTFQGCPVCGRHSVPVSTCNWAGQDYEL